MEGLIEVNIHKTNKNNSNSIWIQCPLLWQNFIESFVNTTHPKNSALPNMGEWIPSVPKNYKVAITRHMTTTPCAYFIEENAHGLMMMHYSDVIMDAMTSQITSLTIVYSTVYSDADQIKYQSSASLAFLRGIHRWLVNSPHKGPVTRKMFPFNDVIKSIREAVRGAVLSIAQVTSLYTEQPMKYAHGFVCGQVSVLLYSPDAVNHIFNIF